MHRPEETELRVLKGTMMKRQTNILRKISRFYLLQKTVLYYYEQERDFEERKMPKGFYNLADYQLQVSAEKLFVAFHPRTRTGPRGVVVLFKVHADYERNRAQLDEWVAALLHNQRHCAQQLAALILAARARSLQQQEQHSALASERSPQLQSEPIDERGNDQSRQRERI